MFKTLELFASAGGLEKAIGDKIVEFLENIERN